MRKWEQKSSRNELHSRDDRGRGGRNRGRDPEVAGRWLEGLLRAIAGLSVFPNRHELAPERHLLHRDVRRLLYRSGGTVYRVLFFLADTDGDGEVGTVRVLHIQHGSQKRMDEVAPEDNSRL